MRRLPTLCAWTLTALAAAAAPGAAQAAAGPAAAVTAVSAASAPSAAPAASGVAWHDAASDADIARVFALARAERKPLLLYWGAAWCPPCNQLKATLFNRADFIARSRAVVAVQIDGDRPGAQQLGSRFQVRGYPTLVLMAPDGSEITRLPGEVDAPQVLALLQLGLSGGRTVAAVLADARAGRPLTGPEWQLLAFYGWDTDESRLVPAAGRAALLAQLAAACPPAQAQAATRLLLKALAERGDGAAPASAAQRQRVRQLLADPQASRAQMDLLVNSPVELLRALAAAPGADRQALRAAYDRALQTLAADASLSRADRLGALAAQVALARSDQPADALQPRLAPALLAQVRAQVARDDREIRDGHERQAVVTAGAALLADAGLWADSAALLQANLARSHAPYYLMSQLAGQARRLGRSDEALDWYARAHAASVGPATRLQWGAALLGALVELAPQDAARIERVAGGLIAEAGQDPAAFHERSARSLQRMAGQLTAWNRDGRQAAVLGRLVDGSPAGAGLAAVCGRLAPADRQRAVCDALRDSLRPPAGRAGAVPA